jgi:nucleotide-binding universal stress UspA family protein
VIKTILFASDFTAITDNAEKYALDIAKAMGAKLTLIHSVEPVDGANDDVKGFLEGRKADAHRKGEAVAERFRKEGVDCEIRVEIGKRWKVIVDTATNDQYDLVILGSHKVRDGDKVYLGTTTHKVFFATDVPLLVVPS